MNLDRVEFAVHIGSVPRTRGDEPKKLRLALYIEQRSPHARG